MYAEKERLESQDIENKVDQHRMSLERQAGARSSLSCMDYLINSVIEVGLQYVHLTDEETDSEKLVDGSALTKQVSGRVWSYYKDVSFEGIFFCPFTPCPR